MNERFERCISFVLEHETEYNRDGSVKVERDPADPGGTTKYGIDQRSHPQVDVANLTLEKAKEIYRRDEWTRCRCESLSPGWDLAMFDAAINIGMGTAARLLQKAVGATVDGFIGPKTIAAANSSNIEMLAKFLDLRVAYYKSLRISLKTRFLKGWLNRVNDVRKVVGIKLT